MAEFATPSAATISTMDASAETNGTSKPAVTKPEKPDEDAFKKAVEQARKALNDAQESSKAAQGRVNAGRPGKDSPANKRRDELRTQLGDIRTKQQGFKSSRNGTQDKIKTLDTQLKARIQEQKNAKSKIPFRNVEELDSRIQSMQKEVDTGKMKLVDEKKTLTEISALNKQRKAFAGFEDAEKTITDIKNQIGELRKELDNPEYKSLSDTYTTITTELDTLKAEQDVAFKDLNASRDALTKARQNQDEKYTALKKLQDDYYGQKRAYMDYDREANRQRVIKRKQEQDKYFQDKKRKDLDRDLEDAAYPAYADEIRSCDNLIRLLDPSSATKVANTIAGQFAAVASRVVDATGIKGTALPKKNVDEEEFFAGSGKKGKKARGGKAQRGLGDVQQTDAAPKDVDLGRFFEPTVVHQFEQVSLTPPSSQEEVAKVLEQLKEKREFWTSNQKKKTDENVAAVQKRIDALMSGAPEEEETSTESASTTAEASTSTAASTNGTIPPISAPAPANAESDEAELRALAEEDGTAEESNTAPLGEQDGGHVDGEAETHVAETHVAEQLEAVKLNGEGEDGAPVAAAV